MDQSVYKKMRLKEHTVGKYINAPKDYIYMAHQQTYINFEDENPMFYHVFVYSVQDYIEQMEKIKKLLKPETKLWISYQKKKKYEHQDMNRDKTFEFKDRLNLVPYANVSLDDTWSCIGLKLINEGEET